MKILILQGPNLNLIGIKSASAGKRLTLDKLNKSIRKFAKEINIELKIIQTHKDHIALNFIQRNRNNAKGLILIPTSWARYNYSILEAINLVRMPTALLYYDAPFNFGTDLNNSIFKSDIIKSFRGDPIESTISAIEYISKINE